MYSRGEGGTLYPLGFVRADVAYALGEIGDKRAVEPLIQFLKDGYREEYKEAAAIALGKIGDERAVEPLIHAFKKNKNWGVRKAVATSLGKIGNKNAIEFLILALRDEDQEDREILAEALGETGDNLRLRVH